MSEELIEEPAPTTAPDQPWTKYKLSNGEILQNFECSEGEALLNVSEGTGVMEGTYSWLTHYIKDGEALLRQPSPSTLAGMTISNIPVPSTLFINGIKYETDAEIIDLDLPYSITYKIQVKSFPFIEANFEVTKP